MMKKTSALSISILLAALLTGTGLPHVHAADAPVEIVDISRLDTKPELARPLKLKYRKRGITGEVVLRFVVTPTGKVENIVIASFNDADFVEPALNAYETALYTPGTYQGRPVATRLEVKIEFPAK